MKKAGRIVILPSMMLVVLISLMLFLNSNVNNQEKLIVLYPPTEANDNLYHPEAWNKIFNNVSTIVEFRNVRVPSCLAGESIPEILQAYEARIDLNRPEYAYCYVYFKIRSCYGLNQTLTKLGFIARNVCFGHELNY